MSNKNTISYYVDGQNLSINLLSLDNICNVFGSGLITYDKLDRNKEDQAKLRRALGNYGIEIPFKLTKMDFDELCEKFRKTLQVAEERKTIIADTEVAVTIEVIEEMVETPQETIDTHTEEETNMRYITGTTETNEVIIEATEVETINNNTMEDNTMNETIMNKEVMESATANAEEKMGKLESGAKYLINNVDSIRKDIIKHAKKIENMSQKQIEVYFSTKAKSILDSIVDGAKAYSQGLKEEMDDCPGLGEYAKRADTVVDIIGDIIDEENLNGWGKVKAIVTELVKWIVRIFIRVGQILLKLAVTVIVGVVKIGAIGLNAAFRTVGVVNTEVVKPTISNTKSAMVRHKAKKEARKEVEAEFEEYADDLVTE